VSPTVPARFGSAAARRCGVVRTVVVTSSSPLAHAALPGGPQVPTGSGPAAVPDAMGGSAMGGSAMGGSAMGGGAIGGGAVGGGRR
jgi:hypothetical protein